MKNGEIDHTAPDTTAYDEIVAKMASRTQLADEDELLDELLGGDETRADDLGSGWRTSLGALGIVLGLMVIAGFIANPIAGFAMAGLFTLLWVSSVQFGQEIVSSAGGAGVMFRLNRVGRTSRGREQAEDRREIVEEIVQHEDPQDLYHRLDDPVYVRSLFEAVKRDEDGWTMSD